MLNKNALKAVMTLQGLTQADVAKALNISRKTFCDRLSKGRFWSSEISAMVKLLNITNPYDIFFTDLVTSNATAYNAESTE